VRARPFTVLTLVAVVALLIPLASGQGQPAAARPAPAALGPTTAVSTRIPAPAATGTATPVLMARKLLAPQLWSPVSTTTDNAHKDYVAARVWMKAPTCTSCTLL
jgi:hypothetical protein